MTPEEAGLRAMDIVHDAAVALQTLFHWTETGHVEVVDHEDVVKVALKLKADVDALVKETKMTTQHLVDEEERRSAELTRDACEGTASAAWNAEAEKRHAELEEEAAAAQSRVDFREDLQCLLNRYCAETPSNTPDFVLAAFLIGCLKLWDEGVQARDRFHGAGAAMAGPGGPDAHS